MKKAFLSSIAMLFLATGTAHAMYIDTERGRCYLSDKARVPCSDLYGKDWRKIFKEWNKKDPQTKGDRPPFPGEFPDVR